MNRLVVAVVVGALVGAAVVFFLRGEAPAATPHADPGLTGAAPAPAAPAGDGLYVSPSRPGLIVTTTRDGQPLPGVRVELFRAEHDLIDEGHAWRPAGDERTDDAARASFPALAGRHLVIGTAADGARAVEIFDVGRAALSTHLVLTFGGLRRLEGRVVDAKTKQPVPNATVRADPGEERSVPVAIAQTDGFGRFGLELPPSELWRVEASAPGWVSVEPELVKGTQTRVELSLERGVKIDGLVLGDDGAPIASAAVRAEPGDVRLSSDGRGAFTFFARAGPLSVHAVATDGRQGLARLVTAPETERASVQLVLTSGFTLQGVVRGESGADVRVLAEPDSVEVAAMLTGPDGRFEAKGLPKGRYSVKAQKGPGRRASAVGLELPGAGPVELTLSPAGRVTGQVVDEAQNPIGGATVRMTLPRGMHELERTATTGDDGRFDFDELLPSELVLQAHLGEVSSEETPTYVGPGATATLNLVLAAQGRLVGTVTSDNVEEIFLRGQLFKQTVPVAQRRFEVLLAPGHYTVMVLMRDHYVTNTTVDIRGGEVTTVTVSTETDDDGGVPEHWAMMHPELGSGLSFENSPGGVRVDFLMSDCPAARAGVKLGDLVLSIDGEPTRDARDAFERVRVPNGEALSLVVRRDGVDLPVTVK